MDETDRRRQKQEDYNRKHGITPQSIQKSLESPLASLLDGERVLARDDKGPQLFVIEGDAPDARSIARTIKKLRKQMKTAAAKLDFERAAQHRDCIRELETWAVDNGLAV